jgi:hypothetical protein
MMSAACSSQKMTLLSLMMSATWFSDTGCRDDPYTRLWRVTRNGSDWHRKSYATSMDTLGGVSSRKKKAIK